MSDNDLTFLKELSRFVPIIPVLAKADSMTEQEIKEFRAHCRDRFESAELSPYELDTNSPIVQGWLRENPTVPDGMHPDLATPLPIVSALGDDGRAYEHGTAIPEDMMHGHLSFLRECVIRNDLLKLRQRTHGLFAEWAEKQHSEECEYANSLEDWFERKRRAWFRAK